MPNNEENAVQTAAVPSKKAKRAKKPKQKKQKTSHPFLLAKILLYMLCIAVIGIQAMERIDAANALVGSTDSIIKAAEQSMATENPKPEVIKDAEIGEYKYIPVSELSTMNYSDLANWYLTQFPDAEHTNMVAKTEFNIWLSDEILMGVRTQEEFEVALEAAKTQEEPDATQEGEDAEVPSEDEESSESDEAGTTGKPESTSEQEPTEESNAK